MSAFQSALTVLGWCLLDSIWQLALIWMGYKLLTAGNKNISPAGKHNLILLFVFIGAEWFIYSFFHLLNNPSARLLPRFIVVPSAANVWISWMSIIYLIILSGRLLQQAGHYFKSLHIKSSHSAAPLFQAFTDRYAKILGIHRKVQVYFCSLVQTAETSKFFKPLILLPVSIASNLSPQQIEAILVHELFHIRRNDYLTNICMSCFRTVFFFNPFAHLFYKELARERELACDDGVLELGFTPDLYATTLFSLEKFRQPSEGFSLAADGNKPWLLMERIRRVLGKPDIRQKRIQPMMLITGLTALGLIILRPAIMPAEKMALTLPTYTTVIPVRSEPVVSTSSESITIVQPKITRPQKYLKVEIISDNPPPVKKEPEEMIEPSETVFYTDNKISRDYTNQPDADLNHGPVPVMPGSPYVPAITLAYDAQPVIMAADSMREIIIENDIKTIVCLENLKALANLKELQIQIDKNKQELKRIEAESRKHFSNERKLRPLLRKIEKQIDCRKIQVDALRNKLEVSEAEIIHI